MKSIRKFTCGCIQGITVLGLVFILCAPLKSVTWWTHFTVMQCCFIKYTFDGSLGQPKTSEWGKHKAMQSFSKMKILLKLRTNQTKVALHRKSTGWTYWEGIEYEIRKPIYSHVYDLLLPKILRAGDRQPSSPQKLYLKTLVSWASTQKQVHRGPGIWQQGQSRPP